MLLFDIVEHGSTPERRPAPATIPFVPKLQEQRVRP
jgi:hypothetical protein